jgi:hypothetical protein
VRCRWCRARLEIPWWSKAIAGVVFLGGSLVAGFYLGTWYVTTDDPLPLILLAAAVLGLALLAILIEWLLPLQTIVPRDFRDWKAAPGKADETEESTEEDAAEGPEAEDVDDPSPKTSANA